MSSPIFDIVKNCDTVPLLVSSLQYLKLRLICKALFSACAQFWNIYPVVSTLLVLGHYRQLGC